MPLVPRRSHEPELMDRPDNSEAALGLALRDLRHVNRLLGGRRILLAALRPFLAEAGEGAVLHILDVGTGSADLPVAMTDYAGQLGLRVHVTAVDRDARVAVLAARQVRDCPQVRVVQADATALPFPPHSFDIVTASLFLHHFTQEEIVGLLGHFCGLARRVVLINDLRRHVAAWALIHVIGRLTRRNPMFLHDGPLSVLRGFTKTELEDAARRVGAHRFAVEQRWPFRLVLTLEPAS